MATGAQKREKEIERRFIEKAQQLGLQLPPGTVVECESPDFLIKTCSETLGIEVTRLFQPAAASRFDPRQVESFQDRVMRVAADLDKPNDPPVDVLVYCCWDGAKQPRDCRQMAESLVDFVRSHYKERHGPETYQRPDVPQGFDVIRVARPLDGTTNRWQAGHTGQGARLEQHFLSDEIGRKNKLVPHYRKRADQVWLLLVASMFPLSGTFSVPREINTWKFEYDFDRVLLLSEEDCLVLDIARA